MIAEPLKFALEVCALQIRFNALATLSAISMRRAWEGPASPYLPQTPLEVATGVTLILNALFMKRAPTTTAFGAKLDNV